MRCKTPQPTRSVCYFFSYLIIFLVLFNANLAAQTGQNKTDDNFVPLEWYAYDTTASIYENKISISLKNVGLEEALVQISQKANVRLAYNKADLPHRKISLTIVDKTVIEAFQKALSGTNLKMLGSPSGQLVFKKKKPVEPKKQNGAITGTVTNAETGDPMPGASIYLKDTNRGDATDAEGKYRLDDIESGNYVLTASFIGYERQSKTVTILDDKTANINFELKPKTGVLDAVVVQAYGTTTQRMNTGNIARVTADEILKQPVSNPLAAMQGRMTGVYIVQNSGVPGGGFEVRIRGQNSINAGNNPLYIIDGVPYGATDLTASFAGGILPRGDFSPLNFINPTNIKSIEVLKDADATAIYGSRGSNGVVLITTKQGHKGKTRYSFGSNMGIASVTRFADMMNTEQYLEMRREAFLNDGLTQFPFYSFDINGTWDQNRYTDWQQTLIGNTATWHQLRGSVQGGDQQTQFVFGGSYREETTVYVGDFKYERGTMHAKINHHSQNDRFFLMFSVNYAVENNFLPAMDPSSIIKTIVPNAPKLYDDEGNLNWENSTWTNPLAALNSIYKNKRNSLLANATLAYRFSPSLKIQTNLGYTDTRLNGLKTFPNTYFNPAYGITSDRSKLSTNDAKTQSWIIEPQIDWSMDWENSVLSILLGATFQEQTSESISLLGIGFANNNLIENPSAASILNVSNEDGFVYHYNAIYGRINYKWKQKYILNITGRRDGSSRFGPRKHFANFGAFGAAWLFTEEKIIQEVLPILSFGKLRASYGITGNDQIGDYQFLDTYETIAHNYNGIIGLSPMRLFNPNFAWEANRKMEFAIEIGLWDNRIIASVSHYRNRSSNQLVGKPLPGTTGFESIQYNLDATVENTGWEFEFSSKNIQNQNWNWETAFNLTVPQNKLVNFPKLEATSYANQLVIGKPLTVVKLYNLKGVNPETGLFEFMDYNKDDQISSPDDRQYAVDTAPTMFGGIYNTVSFKNWELSVFFQFVKQKGFNYYYFGSPPGMMLNQPADAFDRWQHPGDNATMQKYTTGADPEAFLRYSRFGRSSGIISDASFIRLKNLALAYTIPLKNDGLRCRLSLQGRNILTWTKFKGDDPEQLVTFLPPLKQFSIGIEFNF